MGYRANKARNTSTSPPTAGGAIHGSLASLPAMTYVSEESADEAPGNFHFQSGDIVRSVPGGGPMTVILAFGDQVHCEWLIGTEPQQRAFPASVLRLVCRGAPRAR
jgi:uncharacterized protein YodC (DUF2158 family)